MAARIRARHDVATRDAIQTTQLVKRLMAHALGDSEIMTVSQIRSAEILLKKTLPDLQSVAVTDGDGGPVKMVVEWAKSSA